MSAGWRSTRCTAICRWPTARPMWEAFKATAPANIQFDPPFANAVAVGADAPLIDQLVAWTGRQP